MKSTGIIREMDELGRIVIPIELRRSLDMTKGTNIEIFVEDDVISRVVDINTKGTMFCIQEAVAEMRKNGAGSIVNVASVAGVDDRDVGVEGSRLGCALLWIAHDHHVGIARHHFDGVLQGLALGHGGGVGIGKAEHRATHPQHGGLEGKVGPGGGLIE